jgi:hypothetical protein
MKVAVRRALLGLSLAGAAFGGLDCLSIPPAPSVSRFMGCFQGDIGEPAAQGSLRIVLEEMNDVALQGCLVGRTPEFQATFAGSVLQPDTQARLVAMSPGGSSFTLLVEREPPDNADAVTLTVRNETGTPFVLAPDLPRCPAPTTCDDLGIALPFLPGGMP